MEVLPAASECASVSDVKLGGVTQNIEVSEQNTTQNIEFGSFLHATEDYDIQKEGRCIHTCM